MKTVYHTGNDAIAEKIAREKGGKLMALTKAFLKGLELSDEKIEAIFEGHTDTVNGLKAQRDQYKADAEKLAEAKAELNALKAKGDDGWQKKYEEEHSAFEAYKTEQIAKEARSIKESAYTDLLKSSNISEKAFKLILKATDFDSIELEADGKTLKDLEKLSEAIKTEYADYITSTNGAGADVDNPPGNDGGNFESLSLSEKMDYANAHPEDAQVQAWLK